ncbi:MAG: transcriptional regulator [Desulfococcaceae bacterium]
MLNGKIPLRPNLAVRIAKATKTSPESWLNMQIKLDIWKENMHIADDVEEMS